MRAADSIVFQVSPSVSMNSPSAHLSIRDASGNVLYDGAVSKDEQITIPTAAPNGCVLLRFASNRPLIFQSMTLTAPNHPPVRFRLGVEANHPVHLHTNGCGDFTMLARSP